MTPPPLSGADRARCARLGEAAEIVQLERQIRSRKGNVPLHKP
jgi:hypothetical protein